MDAKLMKLLLDLRLALDELQASMQDIDKAIQEIMACELDIKKGGSGKT